MESWVNSLLNSDPSGLATLGAAFLLGLSGLVTCGCNYALFALVAGYSGTGNAAARPANLLGSGVSFLMGSLVSMALIGALFGYAGEMISTTFGDYWNMGAGLLCILFGLYAMDFLPFSLPSLRKIPVHTKGGISSSIIFGLTVGGTASFFNTCCNPVFPILLATSFVKGSTLWGMLLLSVFALGYTLPLAALLVGIRTGITRIPPRVATAARWVQYGSGALLVIAGFWLLVSA